MHVGAVRVKGGCVRSRGTLSAAEIRDLFNGGVIGASDAWHRTDVLSPFRVGDVVGIHQQLYFPVKSVFVIVFVYGDSA